MNRAAVAANFFLSYAVCKSQTKLHKSSHIIQTWANASWRETVTEQEMLRWQLTPQDSGCVWLPGSVSSWTRCCLNLKLFSFSWLLPIERQNVSHDCQSACEKIPFVTVTWFALRSPWAWSLEGFLVKVCRRILMWSTHLLSVTSLKDYNRQPSQPTCMNK